MYIDLLGITKYYRIVKRYKTEGNKIRVLILIRSLNNRNDN